MRSPEPRIDRAPRYRYRSAAAAWVFDTLLIFGLLVLGLFSLGLFAFGSVVAATRSSELGQALQAPDLVPIGLARLDGGSASPPSTPVIVRVFVKNDSRFDLVGQASHTARWTVQVQGYANSPYLIERSLRAGEQYSFTLAVVVPCGKVTLLEVWVNPARAVIESNFENNRAKFAVDGNACPKAAVRAATR